MIKIDIIRKDNYFLGKYLYTYADQGDVVEDREGELYLVTDHKSIVSLDTGNLWFADDYEKVDFRIINYLCVTEKKEDNEK